MTETKTKTVQDPVAIVMRDGRKLISERDITTCDDWRETAFGMVNFGWGRIGLPRHFVEYPDGTKVSTTPELFFAQELAKDIPTKKRGFLKWLFG